MKENKRKWKLLMLISIAEFILTAVGVYHIRKHTKKTYIESDSNNMRGEDNDVYFETTTAR